MAKGSLNLRVSKSDFEQRVGIIEAKMSALMDVIDRYNNAKGNLDQFIESSDSNYEAIVEEIDENIRAAKKAHAALNETKLQLQETVDQMDNLGREIAETAKSAVEATKSAVDATLKIDSIL